MSVLALGNRHLLRVVVGCSIRFRGVEWKKCTNSNPVVITAVCGGHSNTYDP